MFTPAEVHRMFDNGTAATNYAANSLWNASYLAEPLTHEDRERLLAFAMFRIHRLGRNSAARDMPPELWEDAILGQQLLRDVKDVRGTYLLDFVLRQVERWQRHIANAANAAPAATATGLSCCSRCNRLIH